MKNLPKFFLTLLLLVGSVFYLNIPVSFAVENEDLVVTESSATENGDISTIESTSTEDIEEEMITTEPTDGEEENLITTEDSSASEELKDASNDYANKVKDLYNENEDTVLGSIIFSALTSIGVVLFSLLSIFSVVQYIYTSFVWYRIGSKLGYKDNWFAWVPILRTIMIFELGDKNPWLLLLSLIPGFGAIAVTVLRILATMNIVGKRGFNPLLALLTLVPIANLVLLGYLAWTEPK